jgi:hypothetical protein
MVTNKKGVIMNSKKRITLSLAFLGALLTTGILSGIQHETRAFADEATSPFDHTLRINAPKISNLIKVGDRKLNGTGAVAKGMEPYRGDNNPHFNVGNLGIWTNTLDKKNPIKVANVTADSTGYWTATSSIGLDVDHYVQAYAKDGDIWSVQVNVGAGNLKPAITSSASYGATNLSGTACPRLNSRCVWRYKR